MSTIDRDGGAVNRKRSYDGRGRKQRSEKNRLRIIEVAERGFLTHGYTGVTIAAIAAATGVSAGTIYKTFGGKPGLIRAIYAEALRGAEAVPAERRSEAIQAEEPDPRRILRAWGDFLAELSPRAAPLRS